MKGLGEKLRQQPVTERQRDAGQGVGGGGGSTEAGVAVPERVA